MLKANLKRQVFKLFLKLGVTAEQNWLVKHNGVCVTMTDRYN